MIAVGDKIKIIRAQRGAYAADGRCGYVIDKPNKKPSEYGGLSYDKSGIFVKYEDGYIWNIGTEIQYDILQKGDNRMSCEREKRVISDINVIVPNKVVEVTFKDGDKQKAVCQEPDVFSLEQAISICLTKHLLGGSGAYNKAIRNGIRLYEKQLETEKMIKAEEERIAKRRAKKAAYMKRKAEKKREEQIEIQKEVYVRALREVEKVKAKEENAI